MHGIFVGEIQALEGAGRTCWDFPTAKGDGTSADEAPFELKLDMARQCWDEARHVEISVKLADWMGSRDRRVRREHRAVRGGLQPRPGAAPRRREPGARGPGHRRVHHDEGVRRPGRRPVPRVLRGLDAGRRGHPREDGLGLAAPPHRQGSRSGASRPWSSRRSSTSCSPTAACARTRRTRCSAWPAGSGSWPASPTTRSTRSPSCRTRRCTRPRTGAPAARAGGRRRLRRAVMAVTVTPAQFTYVSFDAAPSRRCSPT